jgi:hypothetical protein
MNILNSATKFFTPTRTALICVILLPILGLFLFLLTSGSIGSALLLTLFMGVVTAFFGALSCIGKENRYSRWWGPPLADLACYPCFLSGIGFIGCLFFLSIRPMVSESAKEQEARDLAERARRTVETNVLQKLQAELLPLVDLTHQPTEHTISYPYWELTYSPDDYVLARYFRFPGDKGIAPYDEDYDAEAAWAKMKSLGVVRYRIAQRQDYVKDGKTEEHHTCTIEVWVIDVQRRLVTAHTSISPLPLPERMVERGGVDIRLGISQEDKAIENKQEEQLRSWLNGLPNVASP